MEKFARKRLVFGATPVICLIVLPLIYAAIFPPNTVLYYQWKQQFTNWNSRNVDKGRGEPEDLKFLFRRLVRGEDQIQLEVHGFTCNSDLHSDLCIANKPVRINTRILTVNVPSDRHVSQSKHIVHPYARKEDQTAMKLVSPVKLLRPNTILPACHYTHNVPALVFSSGGFTGNLFHEFNEVIIPLFITSHLFKSHIQFIITDYKPWFIDRYSKVFSHLSHYKVLNPKFNQSVHCFPGAIVGLKYHDNLALNATNTPIGYRMLDFKQFLRKPFDLKINNVFEIHKKPTLVLISRKNSRVFLNENEMVDMIKDLGFNVVISTAKKMSNLDKFAQVVNTCSVMVGAHGAGLTNGLFLPDGAVLIQVVPLGLDWAAATYFGAPANQMGVKYMEYKIEPEESSLYETYGRDHPVITDPTSVFSKGYYAARAVYVDGQNLKINLGRFKETLVEALRLVGGSNILN